MSCNSHPKTSSIHYIISWRFNFCFTVILLKTAPVIICVLLTHFFFNFSSYELVFYFTSETHIQGYNMDLVITKINLYNLNLKSPILTNTSYLSSLFLQTTTSITLRSKVYWLYNIFTVLHLPHILTSLLTHLSPWSVIMITPFLFSFIVLPNKISTLLKSNSTSSMPVFGKTHNDNTTTNWRRPLVMLLYHTNLFTFLDDYFIHHPFSSNHQSSLHSNSGLQRK